MVTWEGTIGASKNAFHISMAEWYAAKTSYSQFAPLMAIRQPKKRSSFSIEPRLWDILTAEAHRQGIGMNAALNVELAELEDWRSGKRRFVEAKMPAAAAKAG